MRKVSGWCCALVAVEVVQVRRMSHLDRRRAIPSNRLLRTGQPSESCPVLQHCDNSEVDIDIEPAGNQTEHRLRKAVIMAEKVTKSGRVLLPTGESIIPSSTRADGSVRKAIKVKPGYRPPEDVEVYKNRSAESWKNRGKGGVPGAAAAHEGEEKTAPHKAAANAKRREREKAKKAADQAAADNTAKEDAAAMVKVIEPVDPEVEKAKEARKLAKKLRQARELKEKKESGSALLPEQFEKVIKINELIRQLDKLGFDHEGEKKPEAEEKIDEAAG